VTVDELLAEAQRALAMGDALLCQSCCLDALDAAPRHPEASQLLLHALTSHDAGLQVTDRSPEAWLEAVDDPVQRRFLEGMLAYRRAHLMLREEVPGFVVRGWFDRALDAFEAVLTDAPDHTAARTRSSLVRRLLACNPQLVGRGEG